MNTPLHAMLWELWRTSRTELILRVAGLSALVVLLWLLDKHDGPQRQVVQGIAMMLIVLTSVFSYTWQGEFDNRRSGFSFRLGFTRPATTSMLVVVPMLFLIATAVASFLIPAVLFRLLISSSFPLAGPAVWVAAITGCLIAATWSAATTAGKRTAIIAAACGCALAFFAFHVMQRDADPFLLAIGKPRYFDLPWHQYLTLLAAAALATALTIKAVNLQRHDIPKPMFGSSWPPSLRLPSLEWRGLSSRPLTVQGWFEFRRFGTTIVLLSIAAPLLVFALVSIGTLLYPTSDPGNVPHAWLFALAVCPLAYQIVGADGAIGLRRNQGATGLSAFDATRPMHNDHLIAIKILVIAACSLFGWLCMATVAAMHASLAGNWQAWTHIGETLSTAVGDVPSHWWVISACNLTLFYISSTCALLAFGLWLPLHRGFFTIGLATVYLLTLALTWDAAHQWRFLPLWTAGGYLVAAAIVVACLLALYKAVTAGFLGGRYLSATTILWLIYVASTVVLFSQVQPPTTIPTVVVMLGCAMLLVPLTCTAAAPLALAAHRHA